MTDAEKTNDPGEYHKNSEKTNKKVNEVKELEFIYHLSKGSDFSLDTKSVVATDESLQRKSPDYFDEMLNEVSNFCHNGSL